MSSLFSSLSTESLACMTGMTSTCCSYSRSLASDRAICSRTFLSAAVLISEVMEAMDSESSAEESRLAGTDTAERTAGEDGQA